MISIVNACGHAYIHVRPVTDQEPIVERIDHVSARNLPDVLRRLAAFIDARLHEDDHAPCVECGKLIVRRANETITNYRKRQFCSISCANRTHPRARRRIRIRPQMSISQVLLAMAPPPS